MSNKTSKTTTQQKQNKDYQVKNFTFTWNNYQETEGYEQLLEEFAKSRCTFMVYSKELAPTTGTPHLQGYMSFINKIRPSTISKYFNEKIHIEIAKKCKLANFRYCTKDGQAWVYDSYTNFCGIINKEDTGKIGTKQKISKTEKESKLKKCISLAKEGKIDKILA